MASTVASHTAGTIILLSILIHYRCTLLAIVIINLRLDKKLTKIPNVQVSDTTKADVHTNAD